MDKLTQKFKAMGDITTYNTDLLDFLGLLIVLILMATSVPGEKKHKAEIKALIREMYAERGECQDSNIAMEKSPNPIGKAIVISFIEQVFIVKDYKLFSVSYMWNNDNHEYLFVGLGVFGCVVFPVELKEKISSVF